MTTFTLGTVPLPSAQAALANEICKQASITPTELYCKWEAWALVNSKSSDIPSEDDLNALAAHIREKADKAATKARSPAKPQAALLYTPGPTPTRINVDDFFSYLDIQPDAQPARSAQDSPPKLPQPTFSTPPPEEYADQQKITNPTPEADDHFAIAGAQTFALPADDADDKAYADRTGSGRVDASFNAHNDSRPSRSPITLTCLTDVSEQDSRYMNDDVQNRIQSVRSHLQTLGQRILHRIKQLRSDDMPPVSAKSFFMESTNVIMAVGRIRVELDETDGIVEGRINPSSVVLESEDGNVVKLSFKRLSDNKYPLFLNPGMVVVVEGVNTNGRCIEVHAIYDNAMSIMDGKRPSSPKVDNDGDEILPDADTQLDTRPVARVVVAAGPFSVSTNLKYEPLEDIIQVVERNKPDIFLLAGPFVDVHHDLISQKTPVPFEEIFERRVLAPLRKMNADFKSRDETPPQVVLIPSLDDVHHDYVCPQPPFQRQKNDLGIQFCPNPCVMKLSAKQGEYCASLGMCSLSSLLDISADSICWNKGDRLSAIVSHMLRQRSFYPTFPPSSSVPLDSTYLERLSLPDFDTTPTLDVVVVPSKLKAFAKCVDGGAVAVNPGLLCRGNTGGTYAEITIPLHMADRPRPPTMNEDELQVNVVRL